MFLLQGDNRASLSEAVLIDEIERTSKVTPTDKGSKDTRSKESPSSSSSEQSPGRVSVGKNCGCVLFIMAVNLGVTKSLFFFFE